MRLTRRLTGLRGRTVATVVAVVATALAVIAGSDVGPAGAAVPSGYTDEALVNVAQATSFAPLPGGSFLVAQRTGMVRLVRPDATLAPAPVIDISGEVCINADERGLLAVAVDPAFASNNYVYTYETRRGGAVCEPGPSSDDFAQLSRWTYSSDTATFDLSLVTNVAVPNGNHNGGDIAFGKDGLLYLSVGDGGTGANATALNNLNGKIVRITNTGAPAVGNWDATLGEADTALCNTGPAAVGKRCKEIYETGLRNPYRIAMDPNAATTRYYINDVGENTWEEVDYGGTPRANYGWPTREGHCAAGVATTSCAAAGAGSGFTEPVYDYAHANGCNAITAGARPVDGTTGWTNGYYFADFGCDTVFLLNTAVTPMTATTWATGVADVTQMRFVGLNLVYTTMNNGGQLRRIRAIVNDPTTTTSTTVVPPSTTAVPPGSPTPGRFVSTTPVRMLDTRTVIGGQPGLLQPAVARRLALVSEVPIDATAVSINVTVTEPAGRGWVRAWPAGAPEPEISTVNVSSPSETVANGAVVALGVNRSIELMASTPMHVVIDLTGYWIPATSARGGRYVPVGPARVVDERDPPGPPAGGGIRSYVLTGRAGVPDVSEVTAVAFTLTVVEPQAAGYATIWPTDAQPGSAPPIVSSLNYNGPGDTRANFVIMPVGPDGAVNLLSSSPAKYLFDVAGYFTRDSAPLSASGLYVPVPPQRRADSRIPLGTSKLLPDAIVTIAVPPRVGSPNVAGAVVQNLTVTETAGAGHLTAFRGGAARPLASVLNFTAPGQDRAVLAVTPVSDQNQASYVANVATHLIVDLAGYFTA